MMADPIVNRTLAVLRSRGLASAGTGEAEIPKIVYQIPIGETTSPGFSPYQLRAFMNAETGMAYIYYNDELVASFDVSDPDSSYDPFDLVTARRIMHMSTMDKMPILASASVGTTVEYRALTNNLYVDANGYVTASAAGCGCVECSIEYKELKYVVTCIVHVTDSGDLGLSSVRTNTPTDVFFINYPRDNKMVIGDYNPVTAYVWPNHILQDDNLVEMTSDNPNVVMCDCGILHAIGVGSANICASVIGYPEISATIQITVEPQWQPSNIYLASAMETTENGVLHNDGTEALQTTKSINDIIKYAHENGFDGVKFPAGVYAVTLDDNEDYSDRPTIISVGYSDLDIDFSGATIAAQINSRTFVADGENAYHSSGGQTVLSFDGGNNVTVRNAVIRGSRYLDTSNTSTRSWWDVLVGTTYSKNCKIVDCEICDSNSWGVHIGASMYPTLAIWADVFLVGGYDDSGRYDATLPGWCTSLISATGKWDGVSLDPADPQYNVGSDIWANGDYPACSSRMYNIFWFDEDKNLISISRNKHQHYTYYDKPNNVSYWAVHFTNPLSSGLPSGTGGAAGVHEDGNRSYVAALCCNKKSDGFTVERCQIHDCHTMGGASVGGWNCRLIDCTFYGNGGRDNDCDWDIEDGGANTNIMIIGCNFSSVGFVAAMPCTDLIMLNNQFNGGSARFHAPLQYPRIVSNYFVGSSVVLRCQTSGAFCYNTFHNAVQRNTLTDGRLNGHTSAVYGYVGGHNYNLELSE